MTHPNFRKRSIDVVQEDSAAGNLPRGDIHSPFEEMMDVDSPDIFGSFVTFASRHNLKTQEGKGGALRDAKATAWIMCAVPFMTDNLSDVAQLVELELIKREQCATNESGRTLYYELIAQGQNDVSMDTLESKFGIKWQIDRENHYNTDPHCLRNINDEVKSHIYKRI
jgi:hypothetical protein